MLRLTLLALLLVPAAAVAQPVPGADWPRTSPQAAGWSTELMAEARDSAQRIGTASLLVVQHGQVVDSLGDPARRLELHSVRKSLLSALIGIAVGERRIDLDATLARLGIDDVPPSLTEVEKQATVRDLLASRSGVYHVALYETPGERANRPPRGSHAAGTFWYYNNWDFNALGTIYEHAAGRSIFAAFLAEIAQPVGMQDYRPTDGRYVTGPESAPPERARPRAFRAALPAWGALGGAAGRAGVLGTGKHDAALGHAHRLRLCLAVVDRLAGTGRAGDGPAARRLLGGRGGGPVRRRRPGRGPRRSAPDRRHFGGSPPVRARHVADPPCRARQRPRPGSC